MLYYGLKRELYLYVSVGKDSKGVRILHIINYCFYVSAIFWEMGHKHRDNKLTSIYVLHFPNTG